MKNIVKGRAWCFPGVMDVDWEICPVEHLESFREDPSKTYDERMEELGRYCMSKVDPEFPSKVKPGDIIVGGKGFGYGHDHDHACMSIRGTGVAAVICEATNTNFTRNAIHHGLPVIEIKNILSFTADGDELEIDLDKGIMQNFTAGKIFNFEPYPDFLIEILEAGGLFKHLEAQVKMGTYL